MKIKPVINVLMTTDTVHAAVINYIGDSLGARSLSSHSHEVESASRFLVYFMNHLDRKEKINTSFFSLHFLCCCGFTLLYVRKIWQPQRREVQTGDLTTWTPSSAEPESEYGELSLHQHGCRYPFCPSSPPHWGRRHCYLPLNPLRKSHRERE